MHRPDPRSVNRHPPAAAVAGFSLIEWMMVLAIVAILTAVATPGLQSVVESFRVRHAVEALRSTIYLARSEAIRRGGELKFRRAATHNSCPPQATPGQWECGWMVFVDANDNNRFDADEALVQSSPPVDGVSVYFTSNHAVMPIDRWGQFNGSGSIGFVVRPLRTEAAASTVVLCMSSGGRLATRSGVKTC